MTAGGDLAGRGRAYGMPGIEVDGNDVLAVYAAHATRPRARARSGGGPSLIVADTYRFYGHNVGEAIPYRSNAEVEERRKGDPILRYETWLQENGHARCRRLQGGRRRSRAPRSRRRCASRWQAPTPIPATALDDLFADSRAAWSTL